MWGIPSCRSQDFVPRSRYCLPNIIVGDYKIVRPKGTPLPALKYKYQGALVPLEPPPEVITEKKTSTALSDMEPYRAFSLVVYGPLPHGIFQAKPLRQWSLVGLFFLIFNCFGKIRPGTHQTLGLIELKNRPTLSFLKVS